jgi:hypothetical protein
MDIYLYYAVRRMRSREKELVKVAGELRENREDLGHKNGLASQRTRQARLGSFEGDYAAVSTAPVAFICLAASSSCLDCWIWPSIP